ncbi:MAG: 2-amino-4-hydroxy-6-hydroxymethyldihydropteridine diphosphokinase [Nanoarchaeota archaeon]|nr:2-amino-4-hydroxy-6-hydroxymethyldihydropteridine diphosphokinase [Nanoarchaeota archaeon]
MIVIALGTNQGDKTNNLKTAIEKIDVIAKIKKISKVYQTEPVDTQSKEYFLNAAVEVITKLTPKELLEKLLEIENEMGRIRKEKNDPRTIDLDLLFYNNEIIKKHGLTLPHPRIKDRFFVLDPLNDLDPEFIHPVLNVSMKQLLLNKKRYK